jgi:hypothetical protein
MINSNAIAEGLERGDLARLVHNELHIDEFSSKLGDDADIVVVSFKVSSKEPAIDLINFIEKGYDFVIDADMSPGEMDDGDYIVYVELDRKPEVIDQIIQLIEELENLTEIKPEDWRIRYYKSRQEDHFSREVLASMIPTSPKEYERKYGKKEKTGGDKEIDDLKTASGIKVDTKAPKNDMTEWLRNAANIIR